LSPQTRIGRVNREAERIELGGNAEAGLKTTERQVEDQSQKFHLTEIDLATERQMVLDLKAKLQKSKDAARVASEAVEAVVKASYERGVAGHRDPAGKRGGHNVQRLLHRVMGSSA